MHRRIPASLVEPLLAAGGDDAERPLQGPCGSRPADATRSKSWTSRTRISGNWRASTLLRKLNARDYAGASAQLDLRDRAGGQGFTGLLLRRQAETALAETPDGAQPTWFQAI